MSALGAADAKELADALELLSLGAADAKELADALELLSAFKSGQINLAYSRQSGHQEAPTQSTLTRLSADVAEAVILVSARSNRNMMICQKVIIQHIMDYGTLLESLVDQKTKKKQILQPSKKK